MGVGVMEGIATFAEERATQIINLSIGVLLFAIVLALVGGTIYLVLKELSKLRRN